MALHNLGSIVQTTDASAAVTLARQYDAWGSPLQGSSTSGYAYTSREWDTEIGLYYYRARYYDPSKGRFISEDPIGTYDGPNRYTYVHNWPTVLVDPTGRLSTPAGCVIKWVVIGTVGGAAAGGAAGGTVGAMAAGIGVIPGTAAGAAVGAGAGIRAGIMTAILDCFIIPICITKTATQPQTLGPDRCTWVRAMCRKFAPANVTDPRLIDGWYRNCVKTKGCEP